MAETNEPRTCQVCGHKISRFESHSISNCAEYLLLDCEEARAKVEQALALNRLLRCDLENVKRMWRATIDRNKKIEAALQRFADINLCGAVDERKLVYDILNARKALKGE